ncbi:hypothetical protein [Roseiconus nitratireducens]|uniref:hypothetical protein n=1 Tax=Roseiconus nitratireducens TaxID=2605748 RepID=UPI001375CF66|nr:hypothetical protein [Roseiconus nitratireducens]
MGLLASHPVQEVAGRDRADAKHRDKAEHEGPLEEVSDLSIHGFGLLSDRGIAHFKRENAFSVVGEESRDSRQDCATSNANSQKNRSQADKLGKLTWICSVAVVRISLSMMQPEAIKSTVPVGPNRRTGVGQPPSRRAAILPAWILAA